MIQNHKRDLNELTDISEKYIYINEQLKTEVNSK